MKRKVYEVFRGTKYLAILTTLIIGIYVPSQPIYAMSLENNFLAESNMRLSGREDYRSSNFIAAFGVETKEVTSGKAKAYASMVRIGGSNTRITVILEEKVNGTWKKVDDVRYTTSKVTSSYTPSFNVKSNRTYRFKGVFEVLKDGKTMESRTSITSSFTGE